MQGLVSGLAFPSVYNLFSVWTSPEERATLMSIVYSAVAGATVVNFPLSSLLCETGLAGGWPMIFYIPGASGLILSVVFYQVAFSSPANHPRISIEEQKYLLVSCRQSVRQGEDKLKVPWLALVKSVPLYALCVTHMSFSWCFYLTAVNIPLLAKEEFNMGVMEVL
jgi:ACS family sodium-dependent inorganic phosphate cotransporter-like MFS transporter 5